MGLGAAGLGGMSALKELRNADVRITIVDKRDYYTFQPLLYLVVSGALAQEQVKFETEN